MFVKSIVPGDALRIQANLLFYTSHEKCREKQIFINTYLLISFRFSNDCKRQT